MSQLLASIARLFAGASNFSIMLFISLLAHITLLLAIGFNAPKIRQADAPMLEIAIVNSKSASKPEKADFLANKTQDGGGSSDKKKISKSPRQALRKTTEQQTTSVPPRQPAKPRKQSRQHVLTAKKSTRKIQKEQAQKNAHQEKTPTPPAPPAVQMITDKRAELAAALDREWEAYQKRPKRKFITARTKEYKYASYMDAWRQKVERIGNLNYPVEAKRRKLTGLLMLEVAINQDGTINSIRLVRSSGRKILDEAAKKIVRMSAPFAPLPAALRKEVDILHITRTWQFKSGNKLVSR